MPRRKHQDAEPATAEVAAVDSTAAMPKEPVTAGTADIQAPDAEAEAGHAQATPPVNPYRAIFTCPQRGFEMGENFRFKQRVFSFAEKPGPEVTEKLKAAGYTYRPQEKAWTVPANPVTRLESERLAAEFAGRSSEQAAGR